MEPTALDQYIETIPDPQTIRERLSENIREAKLLRRLLKLSEDKQQARLTHDGGQHAD
jgi:hypothetical protein